MANFPAPPIRTPYQDGSPNVFSRAWAQWYQAITNAFNPAPFTVTGSRGGNTAIESLLSQLAAKGIIIDNTTP